MGAATETEQRRYWELQEERAHSILSVPEEQLFEVQKVCTGAWTYTITPLKIRLNGWWLPSRVSCRRQKSVVAGRP